MEFFNNGIPWDKLVYTSLNKLVKWNKPKKFRNNINFTISHQVCVLLTHMNKLPTWKKYFFTNKTKLSWWRTFISVRNENGFCIFDFVCREKTEMYFRQFRKRTHLHESSKVGVLQMRDHFGHHLGLANTAVLTNRVLDLLDGGL